MPALLSPGTPSAVGSLPHLDVDEAARMALALTPELPCAPQLPGRHVAEGMLAQVAAGAPGIAVDGRGGLVVDRRRLGAPDPDQPLDAQAWASTVAFLRTAAAQGHTGPVKVQVAGPVTLGLALAAAGARVNRAFPIAGEIVGSRVTALLRTAAQELPGRPVVLVLDEPGLVAYPGGRFPLGADDTIDLLSGGLATAGRGAAMAGVHCCGPTDWRLVLQAGPDLLSMPVDAVVGDDASALSTFLDRGGWIAWGAVPTDRPLGDREDVHWRRLTELWCELSRNGCDPMRLRTQAIITPACGLAFHGPEQIATVHHLVRRVAERVQDQAIAARMSAGA